MFLTDGELDALLGSPSPAVSGLQQGVDVRDRASQVQPCSLDLRIGDIFQPGAEDGALGSPSHGRQRLTLETGATAVVTTSETCAFPDDIGAIGFPPSSVSAKGLLMTNPGHVDPGYRGPLSFTVINMASDPYELRQGDRIVTLLLFRTSRAALADYTARVGAGPHGNPSSELLAGLSSDFLNVTDRATRIANSAEARTRKWGLFVPMVVGVLTLLTVGVSGYLTLRSTTNDKIGRLEQQVAVLQAQDDQASLEARVADLEKRLAAAQGTSK